MSLTVWEERQQESASRQTEKMQNWKGSGAGTEKGKIVFREDSIQMN